MDTVFCNIRNDILPLYVDEVVSEDSCNMVADRLSQCASCRQQYENMKSEIVIEIPNVLPLSIPDVTVNTRKGVYVSYAPTELAV